ncbi:hypothetical protein Moror_12975 [Moniliophthora roreri MCA 2997]|uniref:Uncharacterized protein n=1 Tax=Moniliophthora roreri (strain MCA 2997) TaxID=1381753 RepID=V2XJL6_MONRO|nr:hypothetical protein Moror_12975 [Moniliophthora roreri MCA 2997]
MPEPPSQLINTVELAALLIPGRNLGVKQQLRVAIPYLPIPLCLGWGQNIAEEQKRDQIAPPDEAVPGLVLTHIASGATRAVRAPWMHHLYSQVLDEMNTTGTRRSKGVTFYIEEAGYSSQITFPHYVVVAILLVQLLVGVYAVSRGCQFREGLLILTGLVIRIAEGVLARQFPFYEPPRAWTKETKYALHTGMTTTHLVLVSHRPKRRPDAVNVLGHGINLDHKHINLEDTAAPMRRTAHGRQKFLEKACCTSLFLATWAQKSIGLLYPANGYLYAVTLMVGSVAMEVITIMCPLLPRHSELIPLQLEDGPRANMLDALAAACQSTNSVSVGFVEAILPDRHGNHTDYHYINRILTSDIESLRRQPHPSHPWSDTIHKAALRRRPAGQVSQPGVSSVSFGHNSTTISQG